MTIGERIRDARKAAGLTQQELAEKVGIRNTSVSKWESGAVKQIPTERLMVLAEALGKTPSELLGWDDAKERMAVTGVTMDELAAEMNLAAADIRHILSGGGGGVGTVAAVAGALADVTEEEQRVIRLYRLATPDDQLVIKTVLKKYDG